MFSTTHTFTNNVARHSPDIPKNIKIHCSVYEKQRMQQMQKMAPDITPA